MLYVVALVLAYSAGFGESLSAQKASPFPGCATDALHEAAPDLQHQMQRLDQRVARVARRHDMHNLAKGQLLTLPVVVHVINPVGQDLGIDLARTQLAITLLNQSFANTDPYDPTRGVSADIAFCLAQRNDLGAPSTGLEQVTNALADHDLATEEFDLKQLSRYQPLDYINIYVVASIRSGTNTGVAGYARFPSSHGDDLDGIVMEADYFGTSAAEGGVLTHEMGHYLGLYHTFQGGCGNDDCQLDGDRVCDTPPDNSTARVPCTSSINSCNTDTDSGLTQDEDDDIFNYMDYTTLTCMTRFSAGQADRMRTVTQTERASLLSSDGCQSPCPTPLAGVIVLPPGPYVRGQQLTFTAQVPGATQWLWTIGAGQTAGSTLSYTPTDIGQVLVELYAEDGNGNCRLRIDTTINIECEVRAGFVLVADSLRPNGTISLIARDGSAPLHEFTVNGSTISSTISATYTFPSSGGSFRICHTAANAFCSSDSCRVFSISGDTTVCTTCVEICDNGIDDDNNGYVDCYDINCECFDGVDCVLDSVKTLDFAARVGWVSNVPSSYQPTTATSIIAANLDPQAGPVSEIIAISRSTQRLLIFQGDGSNADMPDELSVSGGSTYNGNSPVAADLNGDGIIELVTAGLSAIEIFTNFRRGAGNNSMDMAKQISQRVYSSLQVADFDGDGHAEIFGNELLLSSPTGSLQDYENVLPRGFDPTGTNPLAADMLRPIDCGGDPDCNGLELVDGNHIYSVDLRTDDGDGIEIKLQRTIAIVGSRSRNFSYTSVADVDHDGLLDIVLSAESPSSVIVYNRNGILLQHIWPSRSSFQNAGSACIVEIYDDREHGFSENLPEMLVVTDYRLTAYNLNAAARDAANPYWWSLPVNDPSGFTGVTAFDFNGDDKHEIIYHDEDFLRVAYGGSLPTNLNIDAERNYYKLMLGSITASEIPIVADVDGDGEAEIIMVGAASSRGSFGQIHVIESDPNRGSAWAGTRSFWNQREYNYVNINDDLKVPRQQQAPQLEFPVAGSGKRPLNRFLCQQPLFDNNFEPLIPVADATVDLISVACDGPDLRLRLNICNDGSRRLSRGVPITLYDRNPTLAAARALRTDTLRRDILIGVCDTFSMLLPPNSASVELFVVVNDNASVPAPFSLVDDFPSTGTAECDFVNNLLRVQVDPNSAIGPDLGPDITSCATAAHQLSVSPSWTKVLWSDGSSDSVFAAPGAGKYWVQVETACGRVFSDTIVIRPDTLAQVEIGADQELCVGEELVLTLPNFEGRAWYIDSLPAHCTNCDTLRLRIVDDVAISVVARIGSCYTADTLQVLAKSRPHRHAEHADRQLPPTSRRRGQ